MTACQSNKSSKDVAAGVHKVVCQEVLQTTEYTYLRVKEDDIENWLAVPSMDAKVGSTYYYENGMDMVDFKSKELNRTFAKVIFLESVSNEPIVPGQKKEKQNEMNNSMQPTKPKLEQKEVKVEAAAGGITVAELFKNKKNYNGKTVKVKGEVVKFSQAIMSKNWIHLQDGTKDGQDFDLTITTDLEVKVGDVITVEGKVALDKDFGYGYFYKVIVEEGKIVK